MESMQTLSPAPVAAVVSEMPTPAPIPAPAPIVFASAVVSVPEPTYGDTIDLKNLRHDDEVVADSHVINLKSRQ